MIKKTIFWLSLTFITLLLIKNFKYFKTNNNNIIYYSEFLNNIKKNNIEKVTIKGKEINIKFKNNKIYKTFIPINDSNLINKLYKKKIKINSIPIKKPNIIYNIILSWLPIILILLIWIIFIKQIKNTNKQSFFYDRNKAKIKNKNNNITFKDVAGCDEAKEEVKEIVKYLKKPKKFQKLGGRIPKGILMIGPPGTGKTLLAKAISGEAKVPFYSISGSDFVEIFAGIGASRVRNMFEEAKKNSPCIIFIDEIDAVGRKRGIGLSGGHDEREQTLNQMLVEMDGFDSKQGVIIIAATNRPDVLDPALLRPGRFDRQVMVDLPDINGRKQIIKIHTKNTPLNKNVDISIIAKSTPGFSGADLSNLINESALLAAKNNKKNISMKEIEKSKDKIIMGNIRKSLIMTEKEKEYTAYHESGHTIVGKFLPENDPVYKVTIIPRGKSLGVTYFMPEKDNVSISKKKLENKISTLYAGRIAEEIIYGKDYVTTGSVNDIKTASLIAMNMITKWGFSENIPPIMYNNQNNNIFKSNNNITTSEHTNKLIDQEINKIIKKNYKIAKEILIKNINILHKMKNELIKKETLNKKEIDEIINKEKKLNKQNNIV